MRDKAFYPTRIWDGTSDTRKDPYGNTLNINRAPDFSDWDQVLAEIISMQETIPGGGFLHVKQFGAVGDGITDDSMAINLAILSANQSLDTVWFGAGTYFVTTPINLLSNVSLLGAGPDKTIITVPPGNIAINYNSVSDSLVNTAIRDLAVDGKIEIISPAANEASNLRLSNIRIISNYLHLKNITDFFLDGILTLAGGIFLENVDFGVINRISMLDSPDIALKILTAFSLSGNIYAYNSGGSGVHAETINNCELRIYSKWNTGNQIYIGNSSTGSQIRAFCLGNSGSSTTGLYIENSEEITIGGLFGYHYTQDIYLATTSNQINVRNASFFGTSPLNLVDNSTSSLPGGGGGGSGLDAYSTTRGNILVANGSSWATRPIAANGDFLACVSGTADWLAPTTNNITEGSRLYYTQTRFDDAFAIKTTSDLAEGTNLYYTPSRFNSAFASKNTDYLSEGPTNYYYTPSRFNTDFASKTTDNLNEGSSHHYLNTTSFNALYPTLVNLLSVVGIVKSTGTNFTAANAGDLPDLSATYATVGSLSSYLTTASASSTYETQSHATSTYETQSHASSTYQTIAGMSSYLTTSSAASTYQPAFTSQTAHYIFAAPSGSVGVPGFRLLVSSDIPDLSAIYQPLFGVKTTNYVFCGPSSGPNGVPDFRALAIADLPTHTHTISQISDFPSQTSNSGKFITTDGATLSFGTPVGNVTAKYIIQTSDGTLTNAQVLGSLATGLLKNTTTTGVLSIATASDIPDISGTYLTTASASSTYLPIPGTKTANYGYMGPTSGIAATPTWRAMVAADIPDISGTYLTTASASSTYFPIPSNQSAHYAFMGPTSGSAAAPGFRAIGVVDLGLGGGTPSSTTFLRGDNTWSNTQAYASYTGKYILQTSDAGVPNAQVLGSLATGLLKSTTTTGVLSIATAADIPDISGTYATVASLSSYLTTASASSTYQTQAGMSSYLTTASASSTYLPIPGTKTANYGYMGPTSGIAATPTWRALVAADIPDISGTYLTTASASSTYQTQGGMSSYLTTASAASTYSPKGSKYIAQGTTDAGLTGAQFLGSLSTGLVKNTTTTGVLSIAALADINTACGTITANFVHAGPTTGSAANPGFRALVAADIPDVSGTYATVASLSSYLTTASASSTYLPIPAAKTANFVYAGPTTAGPTVPTWRALVAADIPDISGTYLTTASASSTYLPIPGTKTANYGYMGPTSGIAATPTWRALVAADIPDISGTYLTTASAASTYSPKGSKYIVQGTSDAGLTGAQFLGGLSTGLLKSTVTTGVLSIAGVTDINVACGTITANYVHAGPTSGGAANPGFRALVAADIPDISGTYLTTASASSTYLPIPAAKTANFVYAGPVSAGPTVPTWRALVASDVPLLPYGPIVCTYITNTPEIGLTNSFALSTLTTGLLKVSTSTGALTTGAESDINNTFGSKAKNLVYATSSSGSSLPGFRALVASDIPDISATYVAMTGNQSVSGVKTFSDGITTSKIGIVASTYTLDVSTSTLVIAIRGVNTFVSTSSITGVLGNATGDASTSGNTIGVNGVASGAPSGKSSFAVLGQANSTAAGANYGLYGQATGASSGQNTGVSGTASGSSSANIAGIFNTSTGTNDWAITTSGAVLLVGSRDIQQLIVKANSTQTANIQEWQKSDGTVLAHVSSTGNFTGSADAAFITTGVIAQARLGSGTANNTTYLRGDGAWVQKFPYSAHTTTGSIVATETMVWSDATAGAITLTLPSAAVCQGQEYIFIKADTSVNAVTISRAGTDYFWPSGATTYTLSATVGKYVRFLCISNIWIVIGNN